MVDVIIKIVAVFTVRGSERTFYKGASYMITLK